MLMNSLKKIEVKAPVSIYKVTSFLTYKSKVSNFAWHGEYFGKEKLRFSMRAFVLDGHLFLSMFFLEMLVTYALGCMHAVFSTVIHCLPMSPVSLPIFGFIDAWTHFLVLSYFCLCLIC